MMELYSRNPDRDTGLEESMWRLGLGGGGGGESQYPERPGEIDCAYYIRTGTCSFGDRCRYNHPPDRRATRLAAAGRNESAEHPERIGQPLCEYYMKTGNCKFGSNCKFHHPRQANGSLLPASFNYFGYPIRPGEKECAYYMKTGQCKFGSTCKYHHPEADKLSLPATAFSAMVQHPSNPSSHQYPPSASWQVSRPPMMPGSYVTGSYAPMLMPHGVVPVQGWGQYPSISPVVSPGSQQAVQARPIYGLSNQASVAMPTYVKPYTHVPSGISQSENIFPERPGQPQCQFFMRTGDCKFGATCKYHHPRDRGTLMTNYALNPLGLPLRPGALPCAYYTQHGVCKFGATCKFDHPMGGLSYSPSASSLSDMPVAPYPIGISAATMAPSSSSLELQPEFSGSREHFSTILPSVTATSGSIGSIFSSNNFRPHLLIQPRTLMSNRNSSTVGGGEL